MVVAHPITLKNIAGGRSTTLAATPQTVGFFVMLAFLLPWLGAGAARFIGMHPRLASYLSIVLAIACHFRRDYGLSLAHFAVWRVHIFLGVTLVASLFAFPWDQPFLILQSDPSLHEWPGYKLTRLVIESVPIMCSGAIAAKYSGRPEFTRGMTLACWFIMPCAVLQIYLYRNDITNDWNRFHDEALFSTIGMSYICNYAVAAAVVGLLYRRRFRDICFAVVICSFGLYTVFLMAQRASLLLMLLTLAFFFHRITPGRVSSAIIVAITLAFVLNLFSSLLASSSATAVSSLTHQIDRFTSLFSSSDASLASRSVMWSFCFERGLDAPLGHGYGAFASEYGLLKYPHNILPEAFFELGFLGFVGVLGLTLLACRAIWKLYWSERHDFLLLSTVFACSYCMKAGNLSSIGILVFWIYVSAPAAWSRKRVESAGKGHSDVRSVI